MGLALVGLVERVLNKMRHRFYLGFAVEKLNWVGIRLHSSNREIKLLRFKQITCGDSTDITLGATTGLRTSERKSG